MIARAPEEPRFAGALALSLVFHLAMGYGTVAVVRSGTSPLPMEGVMSVRLVPLAGGPAGPGRKSAPAAVEPRPPEPEPAAKAPPPDASLEPESTAVPPAPPPEERKPAPPVPDKAPEPAPQVPEKKKPAAVQAPPAEKKPAPLPELSHTPKPEPAATTVPPATPAPPKPSATPPIGRPATAATSGSAGPPGPAPGGGGGGGGGGGLVAGPGPGMSLDSPFPYPWYLELLRRRVSEAWVKPTSAAGLERGTVIYFRVLADGSLGLVEVEQASGLDLYDRSALRAIHSMGRLPSLPTGFREAYLGVHFEFIP